MTGRVIRGPRNITVTGIPELPSLVCRLHTAGEISDGAASAFLQALISHPLFAAEARQEALLALSADPDLRAHADGVALQAEFVQRPDAGRSWGDLCRLSDRAAELAADPSAIDADLDDSVPCWGREQFRRDTAEQFAAERERLAAWLAGGTA